MEIKSSGVKRSNRIKVWLGELDVGVLVFSPAKFGAELVQRLINILGLIKGALERRLAIGWKIRLFSNC
jgi:hypothetical protein